MLSPVAYPAIQYFSAFSHKRHDFRKEKKLNTNCVLRFSLQLLSEKFLILKELSEILSDMYIALFEKYPLSEFNETFGFSTDFRKLFKHKIL